MFSSINTKEEKGRVCAPPTEAAPVPQTTPVLQLLTELCTNPVQMLCPGRRTIPPWVTSAERLTVCTKLSERARGDLLVQGRRGLTDTGSLGHCVTSSLSCGHETCAQPSVAEGQVGRMHLGSCSPASHWKTSSPVARFSYSQPLWVTSSALLLPHNLGKIAGVRLPL